MIFNSKDKPKHIYWYHMRPNEWKYRRPGIKKKNKKTGFVTNFIEGIFNLFRRKL